MTSELDHPESTENQLQFVLVLKDYPIILEKSMTPLNRKKRSDAILEIKSRLKTEMGFNMRESQILKKIQNMKLRVRKKVDTTKGNKKFYLKDWEVEFLKYMEGVYNPTKKGEFIKSFKNLFKI